MTSQKKFLHLLILMMALLMVISACKKVENQGEQKLLQKTDEIKPAEADASENAVVEEKLFVDVDEYLSDDGMGMAVSPEPGQFLIRGDVETALNSAETDGMLFPVMFEIENAIGASDLGDEYTYLYMGKTLREWWILCELFVRYEDDTLENFNLYAELNLTEEEYEEMYREAVASDAEKNYNAASEKYSEAYFSTDEKEIYNQAVENETARLRELGYDAKAVIVSAEDLTGIVNYPVAAALLTKEELRKLETQDRPQRLGITVDWLTGTDAAKNREAWNDAEKGYEAWLAAN